MSVHLIIYEIVMVEDVAVTVIFEEYPAIRVLCDIIAIYCVLLSVYSKPYTIFIIFYGISFYIVEG